METANKITLKGTKKEFVNMCRQNPNSKDKYLIIDSMSSDDNLIIHYSTKTNKIITLFRVNEDNNSILDKFITEEMKELLSKYLSRFTKVWRADGTYEEFNIVGDLIDSETNTFKIPNIENVQTLIIGDAVNSITVTEDNVDNLFNRAYQLTTVVVPGSIKTLSYWLFKDCSSLQNVIVNEGVEIVENSCFENCINLKTLILPNSISKFNAYCFNKCKSLTEFTLPDNLQFIDECVFKACSNIEKITYKNISYTNVDKLMQAIDGIAFAEETLYPFGDTKLQ